VDDTEARWATRTKPRQEMKRLMFQRTSADSDSKTECVGLSLLIGKNPLSPALLEPSKRIVVVVVVLERVEGEVPRDEASV